MDGYTQQQVSVRYTLVDGAGATRPPLTKTWFFDLPVARHHQAAWSELLARIMDDANARLRRQEPSDPASLAIVDYAVTPLDIPSMLRWDKQTSHASTAAHLPWIIAANRATWEFGACLLVDHAGAYDRLHGDEFAELVLYRAVAAGLADEPVARSFLDGLYPGHGDACYADRARRLHNLVQVRPPAEFRAPPGPGNPPAA